MAPTLKLTYFGLSGRAEATRLALHIGGVAFEDERISFEEFGALKAAGKLPFGSVPMLDVDGEVYAESGAILRYAGKLSGLYPKCEKAAMKVDMVADAIEPVLSASFSAKTPEAKQKIVDEMFPRYVSAIDEFYSQTKGPYLLGEELWVADLKIACALTMFTDGGMFAIGEPDCLTSTPT